MMLVDSHCHLDCIDLSPAHENNFSTLIEEAKIAGVSHMLCVCINLNDFPRIIKIADNYDCVSTSVGVHPNEKVIEEPSSELLCSLAKKNNCVAIGETGLDYYRCEGNLRWQQERFRAHISAAITCNKPLIIHTRQAANDTLLIMGEEKASTASGVMHCFSEDWEVAKKALSMNFYISFSGIVTFKNAKQLHEVAKKVPLERLLIETDSPYLAPMPFRGKQNRPAWVKYVCEHIALLRGVSFDVIANASSDNFFRLFSSAKRP